MKEKRKGVTVKCMEDCGADVPENSTHCRNCGAPQQESEVQQVTATEPVADPPPEKVAGNETSPAKTVAEAAPAAEVAVEAPAVVVEETPTPPTAPTTMPIIVSTYCLSDIGHVKENEDDYGKEDNQDYVREIEVDYPAHGFKILLKAGADGIGSSTGGARFAQAVVDFFMAAMGVRLPVFSTQDQFVDRLQFGELLAAKVAKWFFPVVNWVHGMVHQIGEQEFPPRKGQRQLFGSTLVASVTICDTKTGHVTINGYSVGDSRMYLITQDKIEQLTEDTDREVGGEKVLDRWVGQAPSANGKVFTRTLQLNSSTLPFVQILDCSDGLTNMLGDGEIAEVCRAYRPVEAVNELIFRAKNCTVPFGRQFQSKTAIAIQAGDDNIFANLTQITGE